MQPNPLPSIGDSYYNTMFGEFLDSKGNEQYHYMLELEKRLFAKLATEHSHYAPHTTLSLMDLCCGEGTNAPLVLDGIKNAAGFAPIHYIGVDVQDNSIDKMQVVMGNLKRRGVISESSMAQKADVFKGLSGVVGEADVVRMSHGLYYIQTDVEGNDARPNSNVEQFIDKAISKVKPQGFALMFHENKDSDLFSKRFDYKRADDSMVSKMTDAAERIEAAAAAKGYKLASVKYAPKLYFPELSGKELKQLREVRSVENLGRLGDKQKRWLGLLMFAIQPPKEEFATFVSSGKLGEYVESAHQLMQGYTRKENELPYIHITQSLQVIAKDQQTFDRLAAVCADLQSDIASGALQKHVREAMAKAGKRVVGA